MKNTMYTLAYAVGLGTVCALLLTGVGQLTAARIGDNREAERVRNILEVLEVTFDPDASAADLLAEFGRHVRTVTEDGLTLYVCVDEATGATTAVAVPFEGPGLWGRIKGLLALEADHRTIRGVTFYEQEETPGLGGEIASDTFRDQFKGKSIEDVQGRAGITIVRGRSAAGPTEVDGITGATMTSEKVQAMLNDVIRRVVNAREPRAAE